MPQGVCKWDYWKTEWLRWAWLRMRESWSCWKKYIGELELWNPRYGLVNAEGDELIIRHILDSLSGVKNHAG